mgnify:FL=1
MGDSPPLPQPDKKAPAPTEAAVPTPPATEAPSGDPAFRLAGTYKNGYRERLPAGRTIDAREAVFHDQDGIEPLVIAGGDGIRWRGGRVAGAYPRDASWAYMHEGARNHAGVKIDGARRAIVEDVRIENVADGVRVQGGAEEATFRGLYLSHIRDDAIDDHQCHALTVEDSLIDGCYVGVSARPNKEQDGRGKKIVLRGCRIRLQAFPKPHDSESRNPGHGALFKWHNSTPSRSPALELRDNIILIEQDSDAGVGVPKTAQIAGASGNVIVWLGRGPFPGSLGRDPETGLPCFTVTTDRAVWDKAVETWKARHPGFPEPADPNTQAALASPKPETTTPSPSITSSSAVPSLRLSDPAAKDQDDMCVWVHPDDPAQSLVIAADKSADRLFVYDLSGRTVQSLPAKAPGNIDIRSGVPFGGKKADLVAVNERGTGRILVYRMDKASRRLERVDDGSIEAKDAYGGCLFRSPMTGRLYFFSTSKKRGVEQHEISDDGTGKAKGRRVRAWKLGTCEGAVGDDENAKVFIAEEGKGVWEIGGEPEDGTPGTLVAKAGENGLKADVEGLAIFPMPKGTGFLVVSSQGSSDFKAYERSGAHRFLGRFSVEGAKATDGIEICAIPLGPAFPRGLFACHTAAAKPCPVLVVPWERITSQLPDAGPDPAPPR